MLKMDIDANINANNWASNVKKLLERTGFPDVWMFPNSVNPTRFLPLFENKIERYVHSRVARRSKIAHVIDVI